jgi:hypothetical protein
MLAPAARSGHDFDVAGAAVRHCCRTDPTTPPRAPGCSLSLRQLRRRRDPEGLAGERQIVDEVADAWYGRDREAKARSALALGFEDLSQRDWSQLGHHIGAGMTAAKRCASARVNASTLSGPAALLPLTIVSHLKRSWTPATQA